MFITRQKLNGCNIVIKHVITFVNDDGTVLQVKNLLGFAEKVYNKW